MAKNLNMEEFKRLFEEWRASGMTIRDYCANIGMREDRFYYWKRMMVELEDKSPAFIPVQMNQQNGKVSLTSSSLGRQAATNSHGPCEIVYRNGVTLRVNSDLSLQTLRSLILLCQ
jgi:hypothetical protein